MGLTLELPPPLRDELSREAERVDASLERYASLIICLATAMRNDAPETPFRNAVKGFFEAHSVDADRMFLAWKKLAEVCQEGARSGDDDRSRDIREGMAGGPAAGSSDWAILRSWRDLAVHQTDPRDISAGGEEPTRRRISGRGSMAHLAISSEDHAKEKQEEIALEERGWE